MHGSFVESNSGVGGGLRRLGAIDQVEGMKGSSTVAGVIAMKQRNSWVAYVLIPWYRDQITCAPHQYPPDLRVWICNDHRGKQSPIVKGRCGHPEILRAPSNVRMIGTVKQESPILVIVERKNGRWARITALRWVVAVVIQARKLSFASILS